VEVSLVAVAALVIEQLQVLLAAQEAQEAQDFIQAEAEAVVVQVMLPPADPLAVAAVAQSALELQGVRK
jgi:hypothetical protein